MYSLEAIRKQSGSTAEVFDKYIQKPTTPSGEMFFLHELERVITLPPYRFGPHVEECLKNKLLEDVEGTCTGQYYIICVIDPYKISEGRVLPSSGVAEYTINYRAVVWRPFKGETVGFSLQSSDSGRQDDGLFC